MKRIITTVAATIVFASQLTTASPAEAATSGIYPEPGTAMDEATAKIGTFGMFCTGAFISPSWVMTAKHCIEKEEYGFNFETIGSITVGSDLSGDRLYGKVYAYPEEGVDLALINVNKAYNGNVITIASEDIEEPGNASYAGFGGSPKQAQVVELNEVSHYNYEFTNSDGVKNSIPQIVGSVDQTYEARKGDSGSAILNDNGEAISVLSAGWRGDDR